MMEAFGLTQRVHSSVEGVAADPFAFNDLPIYSLYQDAQLRQSTRSVPLLCCCPRGTIVTPVSGVVTKPLLQSLIQRPSASPLQVHPPCGLPSGAHHQHGLPPAAEHAQGALCSLAAHRQPFPAQDGSPARP